MVYNQLVPCFQGDQKGSYTLHVAKTVKNGSIVVVVQHVPRTILFAITRVGFPFLPITYALQ